MALNIDIISTKDVHPIMNVHKVIQRSLMLLGEPGCGKSQLTKEYAEKHCTAETYEKDGKTFQKKNFIDLRLTTLQSSDVRGLLIPDLDNQVTTFLAPDYLPSKSKVEKGIVPAEGVLFFDEFDRAGPDLQAAAMSIILERRFGNEEIPEGWLIVAAGNGAEFSDQTYTLDDAIAERFTIVKLVPNLASFISYGTATGRIHRDVMNYLRTHPDELSHGEQRRKNQDLVAPSCRGWEGLSRVLFQIERVEQKRRAAGLASIKEKQEKAKKEKEVYVEALDEAESDFAFNQLREHQKNAIFSGIVGKVVTQHFLDWQEKQDHYAKVDELMAEEDSTKRLALMPVGEDGVYALTYALPSHIKDLATAKRALAIVNQFTDIQEKNPSLMMSEIRTTAAELCFNRAGDELKLIQIIREPEYKEYSAWRKKHLGIDKKAA